MNISKYEINRNYLSILKYSSDKKLIILDYCPILRTIDKDYNILIEMFQNQNISANEIVYYIKNHKNLKILFSIYNYCKQINGSYQSKLKYIVGIDKRYSQVFENSKEGEVKKREEKEELLEICNDQLHAYYLQLTYNMCSDDRSVLAYSHSKKGWQEVPHILNNNFKVEFISNFGYGSSSYFYVKIFYKGLYIIPYSDWIIYNYAEMFEIIKYSAEYRVDNTSWQEAMEYVRDACNMALKSEKAFVRKYIVGECEKMVNGLEYFLMGDKFEFTNYQQIRQEVHKTGHNLIEFRGMKISGGLSFIEKILEFDQVVEMQNYIKRIENCNKRVQPMLIKEIRILKKKLVELNEENTKRKRAYEKIEKIYTDYKNKKDIHLKELIENNELDGENIDYDKYEELFNEMYPQYRKIKFDYKDIKEELDHSCDKIKSLNRTKDNIKKYSKNIDEYFKNKYNKNIRDGSVT